MNDLSPIGVSTYVRLEHLKKTINSLRMNHLANKSNLYIFSDAPAKGDEEKVSLIRSYIRTIDGFNDVVIVERSTNNRAFNNRDGLNSLVNEYGDCIFLEEDNIVSPYFLNYMNESLAHYRNNENISSISGYLPNLNTSSVSKDCIVLPQLNGWGFGIWKKEYDLLIDIINSGFIDLSKIDKSDNQFQADAAFIRRAKRFNDGLVNALDIIGTYYNLRYKKYSLRPRTSLVNNIGNDDTGVHSKYTNRFSVVLDDEFRPNVSSGYEVSGRIISEHNRFRNQNILSKISDRILFKIKYLMNQK